MICPNCRQENDTGAPVCLGCGTHLRNPITVAKGAVLAGRYDIVSQLGKGGMGVVYKAHDRMLDEDVAIKLLRAEATESEELARRFRSEIKLARKVTHRNVCRIHEYGEHEGLRYISMELIEGSDLRRLLRDRPPGVEEAFDLALQAVQGLEAIHEVGIVHRDLKAPNIMRNELGVVKLMDFGIAKPTAGESTAGTATGLIMGTPEYMSPEQARGQAVDARSDVYSMGIVIFEIFTGELPFRADTPLATLYKQMDEPPPLEGARARRIPAQVVGVLRIALAKDRGERYASASALLLALRAAAAAAHPSAVGTGDRAPAGLAAHTPSRVSTRLWPRTVTLGTGHGSRSSPSDGKRARPAFVAGVLALAVVVAAGIVGYRHMRAETPAGSAEVPGASIVSAAPSVAAPAPTRSPREVEQPGARVTPATTRPPTARPAPPPLPRSPVPSASPADLVPEPRSIPPVAPVDERGFLQVTVVPGAELVVDGRSHGAVTSKKIALAPGVHKIRLVSDEYEPYLRQITVLSGETAKLVVDLAEQAIRKR